MSKPLKKGWYLTLSSGKKTWIQFQFDKLPDFCYVCVCLSHLEQDCDNIFQLKLANQDINYEYGASLRVDGLKYVRPSSSGVNPTVSDRQISQSGQKLNQLRAGGNS